MEITQRVEGDITVVQPDGRIDTQAAEQLDQVLQAVLAGGNYRIVVDMSEVEYISSAGLRSLAAVLVKCRDEGGDMKLAALNERVTRVFKIIGFDLLMSVTDTPEAAIADFSTRRRVLARSRIAPDHAGRAACRGHHRERAPRSRTSFATRDGACA